MTSLPPHRLALRAALLIACVASVAILKLAPFALVASFLAFVAWSREGARATRLFTAFCGALSLVGFLRFLVKEAMPGIVEGGTRATSAQAVSRLREILFAEDALRRGAQVDPDHDGVGSAALIEELTGQTGLRRGSSLTPPVLERYPKATATRIGPAIELGGYLFLICLPKVGGGWTATPDPTIDDEPAERHFVAYAWPSSAALGLTEAFFIDEHERILVAPSHGPPAKIERLGAESPPACDDALATESGKDWQIWRNKRPRRTLPGDRAP